MSLWELEAALGIKCESLQNFIRELGLEEPLWEEDVRSSLEERAAEKMGHPGEPHLVVTSPVYGLASNSSFEDQSLLRRYARLFAHDIYEAVLSCNRGTWIIGFVQGLFDEDKFNICINQALEVLKEALEGSSQNRSALNSARNGIANFQKIDARDRYTRLNALVELVGDAAASQNKVVSLKASVSLDTKIARKILRLQGLERAAWKRQFSDNSESLTRLAYRYCPGEQVIVGGALGKHIGTSKSGIAHVLHHNMVSGWTLAKVPVDKLKKNRKDLREAQRNIDVTVASVTAREEGDEAAKMLSASDEYIERDAIASLLDWSSISSTALGYWRRYYGTPKTFDKLLEDIPSVTAYLTIAAYLCESDEGPIVRGMSRIVRRALELGEYSEARLEMILDISDNFKKWNLDDPAVEGCASIAQRIVDRFLDPKIARGGELVKFGFEWHAAVAVSGVAGSMSTPSFKGPAGLGHSTPWDGIRDEMPRTSRNALRVAAGRGIDSKYLDMFLFFRSSWFDVPRYLRSKIVNADCELLAVAKDAFPPSTLKDFFRRRMEGLSELEPNDRFYRRTSPGY